MKKMIPVYVLLLALLGALLFSIYTLDKRLNAIQVELAGIRGELFNPDPTGVGQDRPGKGQCGFKFAMSL